MSDLAEVYRRKMASNIAGVEAAQKVFAQRTDLYRSKYPDPVTADYQARDDPQRRQAIADDQYHSGLALMYGVAALVEICSREAS